MSSKRKKPQNKTTWAAGSRGGKNEPVLPRARKAAAAYEAATGCAVIVLDRLGLPAGGVGKEARFCAVCKRSHGRPASAEKPGRYYYCCVSDHLEALNEAKPKGSSYVYVCEKGIAFWISPVYSGGRYAGAFLAGKVWVAETGEQACAGIPAKTHGEIDALSRLLAACAAAVSESPDDAARELPEAEPDVEGGKDLQNVASPKCGLDEPPPQTTYPLDRERLLLASLRRGDTESGRRILKELLDLIQTAGPGDFRSVTFRAMELVVLLSRAAAIGGETGRVLFETNNRYFRRIQESKNREELLGNVHDIVDDFSEHLFVFRGKRHAAALRRAERFIWINYTRKLSLAEVADAAGLSPAYFSTVFKREMGENVSAYVNRLRVEKAAMLLAETKLPLNSIARSCGFENQCWFSRLFKNYTGMKAGKYREQGGNVNELHNKLAGQKEKTGDRKPLSP